MCIAQTPSTQPYSDKGEQKSGIYIISSRHLQYNSKAHATRDYNIQEIIAKTYHLGFSDYLDNC